MLLSSFAAFAGGAPAAKHCDPGAHGLCRIIVTVADCKVVKVEPDPVVVPLPRGVTKVMQWRIEEAHPGAGHRFDGITLAEADHPDFVARSTPGRTVITMHNRHTSQLEMKYTIALRDRNGATCPDPLDPTISNQ
jgi:hypothetical protein